MHLPGDYLREIVDHAHQGRPNEICGLIASHDGRPVKLYRTTNNDSRPRVRYNVDPLELLNALREMEDRGWKLMAIYHSHPMGEAYPSGTDIGLAYYPDAVYLIVSLADEQPVVRAFRILNGQVTEEDLEIVDEGVGLSPSS